jgi:hypothetical protein
MLRKYKLTETDVLNKNKKSMVDQKQPKKDLELQNFLHLF